MRKKISFAGPSITQKEIDYVVDGVKNGFYETFDQHVKKLETTIAEYCGTKYALATHTCTLALHLSCLCLDLKEGDEVICTDFSWVATAYAIVYTGAKPVLVDIDPDTWCIDPDKIRKAITSKTKAIMLVHSFGIPADMDEIVTIAKEHNLKIIEDAAPSLGAEFQGKKVGSFGDFGCFSFHGAKIACTGEGGMLLTSDDKLYEKAKLLMAMGRTDRKATFWSDAVGVQYGMANVVAALALAQVERIEELVEMKRRTFGWYEERLGNIPGIKFIKEKPGTRANYCYPSIILEASIKTERDEILRLFKQNNIHARPGFPRMSEFPTLEKRFENSVAKNAEKRGISLPAAANITEGDVDFVCKTLVESIK
jgi:perosamine synthetase